MTSMYHVSKNMILNSIRTKHNSGAELINITLETGPVIPYMASSRQLDMVSGK